MTLTLIQQAVAKYLAAHPFFSGGAGARAIPVLAGNDRSLVSRVEASVSKLGICAVVYPISGDFGALSSTIPFIEKAIFNVRVRENVIVNRSSGGSRQPADYVAEICAQLLQHYVPLAEDDGRALTVGGLLVKGIVGDESEQGLNSWNLIFHASAGISGELVRKDFTNSTPPP